MGSSQAGASAVRGAARPFLKRHTATLLASRAHLAAAVLAFGLLVIQWPLSSRLAGARAQREASRLLVEQLREVAALTAQAEVYRDRLAEPADLSSWQELLQDQLARSGCRLLEFTPNANISSGNFEILDFALRATGSYAQLVDFLDRLERSENLVRVDDLGLGIEGRRHVLSAKIRFLTGFSVLDLLDEEGVQP